MKSKLEKIIEKRLTVARVRDLLNQLYSDKITFSRMVEILNEESGSLLLKELDQSMVERLQKVANKFIIESVECKPFITEYGITQVIQEYLTQMNKK